MKRLLLSTLLILGVSAVASAQGVYEAQWGRAATFDFVLYNTDGTLDVDEVDGGAEVTIDCDGAPATATNDFVDEGSFYSIAITANEMECERVTVTVAATDTNVFFIQTHGRGVIAQDTVGATGNTTTAAHLDGLAFADDELIGASLMIFDASTDLVQECGISDWAAATDLATLDCTLAAAPASGDWFEVRAPRIAASPTNFDLMGIDANGRVDVSLIEGSDATDTLGTAQTGDSFARLGAPTGASVSADITTAQNDLDIITGATGVNLLAATQASIDAIETDTSTTIPATITTAQNDLDIITGAAGVVIANDTITAAAIATDAIGATELAADAIGSSELATDAIGAAEIATDAIGAAELATDAIGGAEIAADAGTEIAAAIGDLVIELDGANADITVEDALCGMVAILFGRTTGGGLTFQNPSGNDTRVTATVNASNERTSQTLALSCQ